MLHPASDLSGAPPDTRFAVPADAPSEVLARTAVAATVHAQARARAGAWEEAAATLRASVELRERLVHAEAAGPAVAARGWHELAIACLALDRADEARTLLGRARSVVALAEPGLAVDALRDAVDDAWSRVVALDDAARTADAGLRLDDALASVMDAASVATVAAVADVTATGGALASSAPLAVGRRVGVERR
ncbi:MAG TPA: hypothetical protein VEZ47_11990, partial [Gemmatirosa sp.]|nr:hypothetical protein [Gemmatirosa sp.]